MRTLAEWLTLQESVHPQSIDMGLARVSARGATLALAEPASPVITVGGTNGKGSTVAHLEALLCALGVSTGLFTSPHLVRYNERIRVDGGEVGDAELIAAFERIEAARGATTLTFFEYNTLAALLIFAQRRVDVAVLEVGLGGRLDATNLVDADVAVLASVGFDHRDWLGDTLELIGAEKAGIFRRGRPAVLGTPQMPASVFAAIAGSVRARWWPSAISPGACASGAGITAGSSSRCATCRPRRSPAPSSTATPPPPSPRSRRCAPAIPRAEAVRALARGSRRSMSAPRRSALGACGSAGRFQVVPGEVEWILDIAHNEPAARTLAAQLRERPLPRPAAGPRTAGCTFAVVGVLADKDAAGIAAALAPVIDHWIVCPLPGPRGTSAAQLAAAAGARPSAVQLAGVGERGLRDGAGCGAAR